MFCKKDSILGVATELFSKKPYHMVAMDDIAKKARVAKGTLYYHFKSKEELYVALLQDGLDNLLVRLKAESGADAVADLKLFINGLSSFFNERKDFFEVLKREEGKLLSKRLKNCYEKTCSIRDLLHSILDKGITEGHFRKDIDIQIVSEIIIGMIESAISGNIETQRLSNAIVDVLIHGIMA
ncbi:TetR family transcriptional regulator [Dissulfurispira thermophila]|uniref:TetR family transcriptional regulator n=1 Tax=Dissulfurispira thermophila TaxID=2715679 RepID=A0A7G1GZ22_9BACT|nr:TetR/AcrR family transcriptional regulator [Dissulfurispira thermophila]BCB95239.1 TetR family transcriptional regulator [Dissulfurispira thermophila]